MGILPYFNIPRTVHRASTQSAADGDTEVDRRFVIGFFDGVYRLTGDTHFFGQLLLRHVESRAGGFTACLRRFSAATR